MQKTMIPKWQIPMAVAFFVIPFLCVGVVFYDFFINNAVARIDGEAIALCIVGAPFLIAGALMRSRRELLSMSLWKGGGYLIAGSAVGPLLLGHYLLPLMAFGLLAISILIIATRQSREARIASAGTPTFDVNPYLALVPTLKGLRQNSLWSHYDPEADTLAINFNERDIPNIGANSEMSDDGVITRYNDAGEVIGLTILHASARTARLKPPAEPW